MRSRRDPGSNRKPRDESCIISAGPDRLDAMQGRPQDIASIKDMPKPS